MKLSIKKIHLVMCAILSMNTIDGGFLVLEITSSKDVDLISGINSGRSNQTMWNLCGIVAAILKMATGRNFSISGINSGHHNLPTCEMALKSGNDVPN
jgi:choline-glycine betaine transporter